MSGLIEAIYIAPQSGQPMQWVPRADLIAGCGIRGDRNFKDAPATVGHPEQITLISAEEIEEFHRLTRLRIAPGDPRRNVVTRGIALNELVGREFHLGSTVLSGVELCEPCATLGRRLSTPEVSPAAVVAAFTHRAGLRARIMSGGTVQPGDPVGL
jgi:MOSC domain-containing protein YiiM